MDGKDYMKRWRIVQIILICVFFAAGCQIQPSTHPTGSETQGPATSAELGTSTETGTNTESEASSEVDTSTEQESETGTEGDTSTEADTSTESDTGAETETDTEPEELPIPADDAIVRIMDYIPSIQQELRYATTNNFTGQIIYDFDDAYLRYGTIKKLAKACEELEKHGFGIKVWDGFRPVEAQAALWEICPDPKYVSHPVTGTRAHCKGSAVDITLVDLKTGAEVSMPSGFDEFSALGDRDYSDCSEEAAKNARLLEDIMKECGFKPYSKEWWHFSDTDSYEVDEDFNPVTPELWYANCQEYINLRTEPDNSAKVLKEIPVGGIVEFQEWHGRYAKVSYGTTEGYVMSSYIAPVDGDYIENHVDTIEITEVYSYEQMLQDVQELCKKYPKLLEMEVIGTSEMGRDIPVIRFGKKDAKYHVLFQGAIHGREHMTAWTLMAMIDFWADEDLLAYGDVCYHIIPMSNPDGVVISQSAALDEYQTKIYNYDLKKGFTTEEKDTYAMLWKANALGVDINRNFPTGWEDLDNRNAPSAESYRGDVPFSSAEACVLRDYTYAYDFDATISYHSKGSFIYHGYGTGGETNRQSELLALAIEEVSGYYLMGDYSDEAGGYKDWAVDELKIPSVTVEIGCQDSPLAEREMYSIFARNYRVLPAIARWLQE